MCCYPNSVLKPASSHTAEQNAEDHAAPVQQKCQTPNETEQLKLPLRYTRAEVAQS